MTKPIEPGCQCVILGAKGADVSHMNGVVVTIKSKAEPTLFCERCRSWDFGWWFTSDKGEGIGCECVLRRIDDYEPDQAELVEHVVDKAVREYIQRKEEAPT